MDKRFAPLLAALVLVGCSAAGTAPSATPSPAATRSATATLPSPSPTSIVVVGDDGVTIELPGPPHKVVSLTPATSELMFALGAGDRLVGRTDYDNYPAEVVNVPVVATFEGVEIEKVVNIEPDLVLAGGNNFTHAEDIQRLRGLGYPVLVLYAESIEGVKSDIELVGQAVGQADAATQIANQIQHRVDEVTQAVAGLSMPSTFYEIGDEPALYGPAPDSFVADEIRIAGGDPVTTSDPAVFEISLEELITADPHVIVLGDAVGGVCPDQVLSRPGWAGITAVRNGDIRPVDDTIVTSPGPRIGDGLAALALAIHPEAKIAPPTSGLTLCASPAPSPS